MAYRYTNTDKWSDAWFLNLKPLEKLLFNYLSDNCDIAGFIEINFKKWASDINTNQRGIEGALKGLQRGLIYSENKDCIYLKNFLRHQKNLPLNPAINRAHQGILKRFDLYKTKFKIENIDEFIKGACLGHGSPYGNGNGNGNGNGKKEKKAEFDFSFVEDKWKELFNEWMNYKKSRNENYKTQKSLEACYRNLLKLSNNDISKGRRVLDQAMGNNWAGLFPIKEFEKEKNFTGYIDNVKR